MLARGEETDFYTDLSREFWVNDQRDDYYITDDEHLYSKESLVGIYKVVSNAEGQLVAIEAKHCFDWSVQCVKRAKEDGRVQAVVSQRVPLQLSSVT